MENSQIHAKNIKQPQTQINRLIIFCKVYQLFYYLLARFIQLIISQKKYKSSILQKFMIIDLDQQSIINLKQLSQILYLNLISFSLTIDDKYLQKLQKMDEYTAYFIQRPTVSINLKVHKVQNFPKTFKKCALGGTFDHLHLGHYILLLLSVLSTQEHLYIGVTGEKLLGNKKSKDLLQPLSIRMRKVDEFVKQIKPYLKTDIFQLNDPYGPTITLQSIEGLIVSQETYKGGEMINSQRKKKNMKQLQIIVCPTISPNKHIDSKLSSSYIRQHLLTKNSLSGEEYRKYKGYYAALVKRLGSAQKAKIQSWWQQIYTKYSQHWRFYHTNHHIFNMLQQWSSSDKFSKRRQQFSSLQSSIIEIAIFFHDIVYRPDKSNNQQQSAKLASQFLIDLSSQNNSLESIIKDVQLLILQTKAHEPSNKLSQVLYDLDMGILNSDSKNYRNYAKNIKKQYQPLVGEEYSQKRVALLKKWVSQKNYFSFEPLNFESNLKWEIFCLENNDL